MRFVADGTDEYVLDSGKRFSAPFGIIGLDQAGDIYGGYDQGIHTQVWGEFTSDELREVARYMAHRWQELADS